MTNPERYRYRIQFEKSESIRFISHLDLHHTWERTLRRAGLPVYHSQGFNPRPKINLSRALPLGQTSECELMDVWLEQEVASTELLAKLKAAAPPGLVLANVERVPLTEASLQSRISSATYHVTLEEDINPASVESTIYDILNASQLKRVRRTKPYDLRPLIESLSIASEPSDRVTLQMQLAAREGASGRPEEVLLEMGLDPGTARIHRIKLYVETDPVNQ
jgi:radical SAM-linked protein